MRTDQGSSSAGRAEGQVCHQVRETLSAGWAFHAISETLSGELAGTGQQTRGQGKDEKAEVQTRRNHLGVSAGYLEDRILDRADL